MVRSDQVFVRAKISQNVLGFGFTEVGLLLIASLRERASLSNFASSRAKAKIKNAVDP